VCSQSPTVIDYIYIYLFFFIISLVSFLVCLCFLIIDNSFVHFTCKIWCVLVYKVVLFFCVHLFLQVGFYSFVVSLCHIYAFSFSHHLGLFIYVLFIHIYSPFLVVTPSIRTKVWICRLFGIFLVELEAGGQQLIHDINSIVSLIFVTVSCLLCN